MIDDRGPLLGYIRGQFAINLDGLHGPAHWARVKHHGLRIGAAVGADLKVVELFAFVHDSRRLNEGHDPLHGARAADLVRHHLNGRFFHLSRHQLGQLCRAMEGHSGGGVDTDPTVQTCWDADRLDLGRVGIKPHPSFLSPVAARLIEPAFRWSRGGPAPVAL